MINVQRILSHVITVTDHEGTPACTFSIEYGSYLDHSCWWKRNLRIFHTNSNLTRLIPQDEKSTSKSRRWMVFPALSLIVHIIPYLWAQRFFAYLLTRKRAFNSSLPWRECLKAPPSRRKSGCIVAANGRIQVVKFQHVRLLKLLQPTYVSTENFTRAFDSLWPLVILFFFRRRFFYSKNKLGFMRMQFDECYARIGLRFLSLYGTGIGGISFTNK